MSIRQLYYTSCEQGLSGYSGFQFNAASPGVGQEVMLEAERLTAYEPPAGFPHDPTTTDIAGAPVSLRYAAGPPAMIAQVAYTGRDFSNRLGNYFAHTIVTESPRRDLGGLLPIELWRASFWSRQEAGGTDLPLLPTVSSRGPLDREGVAAFVAGQPAEVLPSLLSAAELAVTAGDRAVVLVTATSDDAAKWIAAVSYLVPPEVAWRLTFATYHHRPSYCGMHLIGTLPAGPDLGPGAEDTFYLYDMVSGRRTEVATSPLSELLCQVGVADAGRLWETCDRLSPVDGAPSFATWHPIVAAAALLDGRSLGTASLDALADWFASAAGGLDRDQAVAIGGRFANQPGIQERHLAALAEGSSAADIPYVAEVAERRLADLAIDRLAAGESVSADAPLRVPEAVAHARRCAEKLLAGVDATRLSGLVAWSAGAGVQLDSRLLVAAGRRVVGPHLLVGDEDGPLLEVLRSTPALLDGALSHLEQAAEHDRQGVARALDNDLVTEQDLVGHPRLTELYLLQSARDRPQERPRALRLLLEQRQGRPDPAGDGLLKQLWPEGHWTTAEALEILEALTERQALTEPIPWWLDATLRSIPGGEFDRYVRLCETILAHPVLKALPEEWPRALGAVREAVESLTAACGRGKRHAGEHIRVLVDLYPILPDPMREQLDDQLPDLLTKVGPELAQIVAKAPRPVVEGYAHRIRPKLDPRRPSITLGARVVQLVVILDRPKASVRSHEHATLLRQQLMDTTMAGWREGDVRKLAEAVHKSGVPHALEYLEQWYEQLPSRGRRPGLWGLMSRVLRSNR